MKIQGKEIKHGCYLTRSQSTYLEERYENLEKLIEQIEGVESAYYERSRKSEAAYFQIYNIQDESIEISIRNHDNRYSNADAFYYLSNYGNWNQLKNDVFSTVKSFVGSGEKNTFYKGENLTAFVKEAA